MKTNGRNKDKIRKMDEEKKVEVEQKYEIKLNKWQKETEQ